MSERKVLNKYYPPDFDPAKIPKLRLPRNRQYSIRIMAPFNMRCSTCGEYIYKGKKFNSRKETVEDQDYLGLRIFRFYIKCPRCVSEIAFKTDPQNTDYTLEDGASRNFEAAKTAETLAKAAMAEKEEEELNNPMKVLENRTKASQHEMEMLEKLEELKEMNSRHANVDFGTMIQKYRNYEDQLKALQEEEEEDMIKEIFGKKDQEAVKRLHDSDEDEDKDSQASAPKVSKPDKPTDFLTEAPKEDKKPEQRPSWQKSIGSTGSMSSKAKLSMLVKKKTPVKTLSSSNDKEQSQAVAHTKPASSIVDNVNAPSSKGDVVITTPNGGAAKNSQSEPAAAPSALGLLGAYSDSEGSNSE